MDDSKRSHNEDSSCNNSSKSISSSSIGNLYQSIKYNTCGQVCQYYIGPYAITTQRDILLKSLKCDSPCEHCKNKPCDCTRLGDKVIDVVLLKMENVYNKKDVNLHLLEPQYFRKQLLKSYQFFADVKDAPKFVFLKYYSLFPDKQIKVNSSNRLINFNEYVTYKDLPWHEESTLFKNL